MMAIPDFGFMRFFLIAAVAVTAALAVWMTNAGTASPRNAQRASETTWPNPDDERARHEGASPKTAAPLELPRERQAKAPRHHDVRDLIGVGHTIEGVAAWVEKELDGISARPIVDVLEVRASSAAHDRIERVLEKLRHSDKDRGVLRVHFVDGEFEAMRPSEENVTSYSIEALADVLRETISGIYACNAQDDLLLVFANRAAHKQVVGFMSDLRACTETARR